MEKKELCKLPLFDKIDFIRKIVFEAMKVEDDAVITRMLSRLSKKGTGYYRHFGVLNLSNNEIILGELLKSHNISPITAYKWFLLLRSKKDVLEKLQNNEISAVKAASLKRDSKNLSSIKGREIIDEINLLIRGR